MLLALRRLVRARARERERNLRYVVSVSCCFERECVSEEREREGVAPFCFSVARGENERKRRPAGFCCLGAAFVSGSRALSFLPPHSTKTSRHVHARSFNPLTAVRPAQEQTLISKAKTNNHKSDAPPPLSSFRSRFPLSPPPPKRTDHHAAKDRRRGARARAQAPYAYSTISSISGQTRAPRGARCHCESRFATAVAADAQARARRSAPPHPHPPSPTPSAPATNQLVLLFADPSSYNERAGVMKRGKGKVGD
jgi:hypothetical protein